MEVELSMGWRAQRIGGVRRTALPHRLDRQPVCGSPGSFILQNVEVGIGIYRYRNRPRHRQTLRETVDSDTDTDPDSEEGRLS
jgi:hypothetical protein